MNENLKPNENEEKAIKQNLEGNQKDDSPVGIAIENFYSGA